METEHPKTPKKKQSVGRISAACEACKKRKTKCSGGPPPCQLCRNLRTECVTDLSLDMRRRAALQRTLDESKSYQETLNSLIDCVRSGDHQLLQSISEFLQSESSASNIATGIQQFSQLIGSAVTPQASASDGELPPSQDGTDDAGDPSPEDLLSSPSLPGQAPSSHTSSKTQSEQEERRNADRVTDGQLGRLLHELKNCSLDNGEKILQGIFTARQGSPSILQNTIGWVRPKPNASSTNVQLREQGRAWHPVLVQSPDADKTMQGTEQAQSLASESKPILRVEITSPSSAFRGTKRQSDAKQTSSEVDSQSSILNRLLTWQLNFDTSTQHDGTDTVQARCVQQCEFPYFEDSILFARKGSDLFNSDLYVAQDDPLSCLRIPVHLVLPLIIPDSASLSRVYTDYFHGARQMIANGVPLEQVLGPDHIINVDLFFRPRRDTDGYDCASWASELCRSFSDFDQFVNLAVIAMITYMMRWLLVPTSKSYGQMPDMMKPTPLQRMMPHIGAIELLPLPVVRDAVILQMRDWLTSLTEAKLSVNWPHTLEDALERGPSSGTTFLASRFIEHVSKYNNWSVAASLLNTFPEAAGRIRIHET